MESWHEGDHLLLSRAEVRSAWSSNSNCQCVFIIWCFIQNDIMSLWKGSCSVRVFLCIFISLWEKKMHSNMRFWKFSQGCDTVLLRECCPTLWSIILPSRSWFKQSFCPSWTAWPSKMKAVWVWNLNIRQISIWRAPETGYLPEQIYVKFT
jgi:hypothetical protein